LKYVGGDWGGNGTQRRNKAERRGGKKKKKEVKTKGRSTFEAPAIDIRGGVFVPVRGKGRSKGRKTMKNKDRPGVGGKWER